MLQRGRLHLRRRRRRAPRARPLPRHHHDRRRRRACSQHMEDYLQTEWPELKVFLTSITEQWAVIAVQGPKAREVLAPLVDGIDLVGRGVPAHGRAHRRRSAACRAGCSGSASRASSATRSTCRRTTAAPCGRRSSSAGRRFGITPYGTEAMHVLRAEKGYIIVGQETDGTVTPDDLGLAGIDRQGEAGLRRQALARAAGHRRAGPQAARRPADRRPERWCWRKARRSSPIRDAADPDAHARPRHLELLERRPAAARSPWRSSPAGAAGSGERCT